VELDFSHLRQTGWVAQRPSAQRGPTEGDSPPRSLRCWPPSSQSSAPKGATPKLLGRFAGLVSCPVGTVSRSPLVRTRREEAISACEGFGDFLETFWRLFSGRCRRATRKKSYGHPRNLKQYGLLCSQMAKVERERETREARPGQAPSSGVCDSLRSALKCVDQILWDKYPMKGGTGATCKPNIIFILRTTCAKTT
jgi:hypothetical protein